MRKEREAEREREEEEREQLRSEARRAREAASERDALRKEAETIKCGLRAAARGRMAAVALRACLQEVTEHVPSSQREVSDLTSCFGAPLNFFAEHAKVSAEHAQRFEAPRARERALEKMLETLRESKERLEQEHDAEVSAHAELTRGCEEASALHEELVLASEVNNRVSLQHHARQKRRHALETQHAAPSHGVSNPAAKHQRCQLKDAHRVGSARAPAPTRSPEKGRRIAREERGAVGK
eukprot:58186-Rhodomonas_salina.1